MQIILLVLLAVVVVAIAGVAVLGYFNSQAGNFKKELRARNERISIAQSALMEIAAGDAMPVLRASDALHQISQSYNKELN